MAVCIFVDLVSSKPCLARVTIFLPPLFIGRLLGLFVPGPVSPGIENALIGPFLDLILELDLTQNSEKI